MKGGIYGKHIRETMPELNNLERAKELLKKKEINQATMSSYDDFKFERYGMEKLEYTWEIKWVS